MEREILPVAVREPLAAAYSAAAPAHLGSGRGQHQHLPLRCPTRLLLLLSKLLRLQERSACVNKYWEVCQKEGRDLNPYRLGFLQLVGVSETDEQAERDYAKH